ncbi:hypothetical protein [Kribbella italica]|uniref:Uncharacterized protein n=1 Tax=Kribbella italica TaxID=1540520 RepID=A0A7W9MXW8_9ACTN|nr:hypothetical protein [Kribbella italica]MBB5840556.1 hypothetical protein [Kribbella italica]
MTIELQELLADAAASKWEPEISEELARGIEERIIAFLPSRAKAALGAEEAAQRARVIAWERCKILAARPEVTASWGYLANTVRWRLADSVRAEALRRQRHPLMQVLPDRADVRVMTELGPLLEAVAVELTRMGLPEWTARRILMVATEGPRLERSAIRSRLVSTGIATSQAEGIAWLLRGGAANRSAVARLATGQHRAEVFSDPLVRRWLAAAAGMDATFSGGRRGTCRASAVPPSAESSSPGLARTA